MYTDFLFLGLPK